MAGTEMMVPAGDGETIAAVITPPGEGGIAAVRLAGPDAARILKRHFKPTSSSAEAEPFLLRHGLFVAALGEILDEITAVVMPQGRSYTGLEQAEIFCHGGRQVVKMILAELLESGARAAEPGEFTKLAFLNGRIDLTRAEAVAEVVAANTAASFRAGREHLLGAYAEHLEDLHRSLVAVLAELEAAVDFVEEEIESSDSDKIGQMLTDIRSQLSELLSTYDGGRIVREGFRIAVAGRPNAGKSSLFNCLLRQERALVHSTPGTTRDYLSEWIDLGGFAVNLIDTAGLRREGDQVEKAGQVRAQQIIDDSDLVLWMFDIAESGWEERLQDDLVKLRENRIVLMSNKIDLMPQPPRRVSVEGYPTLMVSCITGAGLDELREWIIEFINKQTTDLTSGVMVTSARHQQKLQHALAATENAIQLAEQKESPEVLAFELREAVTALEEITGRVYTEEVLGEIFSKFCIGK